jgi:purine-cytosine permease-like protein
MVGFVESAFASGFAQVTGDPLLSALMFLGFFAAFTMLQGTRLEGKLPVLIPVLFLSLIMAPVMLVVLVLGTSFITYLAVASAVNK